MSRHRNVRSMNYKDEYDGYDDVYGHSVEDDCISPSDAAQWLYDRARGTQHGIDSYLDADKDIPEEDEGCIDSLPRKESISLPELSPFDKARLDSCLEAIRNVMGETVPELILAEIIIKHDFDVTRSLDAALTNKIEAQAEDCSTKPVPGEFSRPANVAEERSGQDTLPVLYGESEQPATTPKITIVKASTTSGSLAVKGFDAPSTSAKPKGAADSIVSGGPIKDTNLAAAPGTPVSVTPRSQSPESSGRNTPVNGRNNVTVDSGRSTPLNQTNKESESQNLEEFKGGAVSSRPQKESKYDVADQYNKERSSGKEQLHLIVIGHVDAGKSTLMGHLLYALGQVTQRAMHKYEQESKKLGKQSFAYAWVLDETGEERSRGITMDVGCSRFETPNKSVTLLDAPGHRDFIPNMISGAGRADAALLVIDATNGEFESGFDLGGQTREHALLVRSLGVTQLGVVVNKLDTVNWSRARFDEISSKLRAFLRQAGFRDGDVTFTPCSGLTGENLVAQPTEGALLEWYDDEGSRTLIDIIDSFKAPERPIHKPFRMSVNDLFKGVAGSGLCASGRIETGSLNAGDKILVCPSREMAVVKSIAIDDMSRTVAFAGDQISVVLSGVDMQNVSVGNILSDPINVVPIASRFECRIVVFNVKVPITKGFPVVLHHQSLIEPVVIARLTAQLHKSTGEVLKRRPRCLGNNSSALIEIQTMRPICIELYRDIKELGRVMLRVGGVTIAAGLVTRIVN